MWIVITESDDWCNFMKVWNSIPKITCMIHRLVILRSHWIHVKGKIDSKSFFTNFDAKYICGRKTTVPEDVSDHLHLAYGKVWKCKNFSTLHILRENNNSFMVLKIIVECNMVSRKFKVKVKFAKFHTVYNSCLEIVLHDFLR